MASLNVLDPLLQSRQPRGAVKLNDVLIEGWVRVEVENNNWFSADTFRVSFSSSLLPADRDVNWFSQQQQAMIEVFAGFPPVGLGAFTAADLDSLIYGQVDDIDIDMVSGVVELIGRDLTAVFIDAKTTEKWPNLTSSQIATQLATRHGLKPLVTATKTKAGKYYEIDHVNLNDQRSEWDMLNYLAHVEQFVVYVKGQELHFEPRPDPKSTPYLLKWIPRSQINASPQANVETLRFTRSLTVSRGIQVVVRSWNAKQKKGFTISYPSKSKSTPAGKAKPWQGTQIYSYTIANLTQEQALQRAQAIYADLVQHEMKFHATLPADNVLNTQVLIQVAGTQTAFDQTYYPDAITRILDIESGYGMTVQAKNHAPDSTVTA